LLARRGHDITGELGVEDQRRGDGERKRGSRCHMAQPTPPRSAADLAAQLASRRPNVVVCDALGRALASALASAEAAGPGLALPAADFVAWLAEKLPVEAPIEASLAALCTDDLYLACACASGDPRALALFDRHYLAVVERAVTRRGASPTQTADLQQVVRERLLLPRPATAEQPGRPRIAEYSGRGNLRAWVRVVATREALRLLGRRQREVPADDDELSARLTPDAGPELGYLKQLYREEFRQAFAEAVAALTDRERMLLRQHALDGLSIDRLADFYGVHRATTARWVEAARKSVLTRTRRALGQRLHVPAAELDSIMRLIHSRLDVTLAGLLRAPGDDEPNT
jgi:RNA polymerase sigma-70 factor (ECF subfamily)